MTQNGEPFDSVLVGRVQELAAVSAFLARSAAGFSGTMLVTGDAGIGKTALVQHASSCAASQSLVLTGACLPLARLTVPFLALRSALRAVPRYDGDNRPGLPTAGEAPHDVPFVVDQWLDELSKRQPVVLVVDDLQWADQSTLDVLMYLIAGPANRRLAIVATLRNGEVGEGHPLQRWLADIRRLPRISWLALGPLDRLDTGAQVACLLGTPPHQSLLQEIFTHTAGNPYLNRLVVAGVAPDDRHLPARLPSDLKDAVLRSWRSLSTEARQLTALMAVGGRPITVGDLAAVGHLEGIVEESAETVMTLLQEAADSAIAQCSQDGTHWWFHHPLIAEVLEQAVEGNRRQRWHRMFAAHEESRLEGSDAPDFQALAALADHHFASGNSDAAYRWALRASDAAGKAGGSMEMLRLLRRAVALHGELPKASQSQRSLWNNLRAAAAETGSMDVELETLEELLAGAGIRDRPLEAAELLVRRAHLRFSLGDSFLSVAEMREAVSLSAVEPKSWQYALSMAELAHAGVWKSDPGAEGCATDALNLARAAGNPRALSYALTANAMVAVFNVQPQAARIHATEAISAAVEARDFWAYVHAVMWLGNATETWCSQAFADLMRRGRQQLIELGAPHVYVAKMAAQEADSYLSIGLWRECGHGLRMALGSDPGTMGDVAARLTAARLAAFQGRKAEAKAHLARAEELFAQKADFINLNFDAIRAEVALATDNPQAAYRAAMEGATAEGLAPTMCEWLVPLAARALADLIQIAKDEGVPTGELLALTDELVRRFPATLADVGAVTELYGRKLAALNLLYGAEIGRARDRPGNSRDWTLAADACQAVSFRWEEAYSCWRAAESLLLHGHSHRAGAVPLIQRGFALAEELQAGPIIENLHELARRARIETVRPALGVVAADYAALTGLTTREREILGHVVAGRSYAEIAGALVISEKTVSSHISNLLRKTGASNRIELSRMASLPVRAAAAANTPDYDRTDYDRTDYDRPDSD